MSMPDSLGYLFPGQGSQFVGMGKDLYEKHPAARDVFQAADVLLGYELSRLCFEGPEDKLTRTRYAQPAIFITSLAALAVLEEKFPGIKPSLVAGLSLGEFTALTAAKAIRLEKGLALVRKRAEAMEACAEKYPGSMASILGMNQKDCEQIAAEAGCELANLNSPDQMVISGEAAAVEKACQLAEARGAKRAIRLKVGGAFHSRLMQEARRELEAALAQTPIARPQAEFLPNTVARPVTEPDEIRSLLAQQLTSPVRWIETMEQAAARKLGLFLEIGPGKVLKGLARKCAPGLSVEPCGTAEDISKLEQHYAAAG